MFTSPTICSSNCCCHCVNRRNFLKGCTSAALTAGALPLGLPAAEKNTSSGRTVRIAVVFLSNSHGREMWPYPEFDCRSREKELLQKLTKGCPGIHFLPVVASKASDAEKALALKETVDGYLVYCTTLSFQLHRIASQVARLGTPMIIADEVLGGTANFLNSYSSLKRRNLPVAGVSSRRDEDLVQTVRTFSKLKQPGMSPRAFVKLCNKTYKNTFPETGTVACREDPLQLNEISECIKQFKASKILILGRGRAGTKADLLGAEGIYKNFSELNEFYANADPEEAKRWAHIWSRRADKVIEPTEDVIEKAGSMYVAAKALLDKYKAETITMNCLGGFSSGKLPSYPCLGFMQLLNDGKQGVCEAMPDDSVSMIMARILTGRPGYVSDPALDTSKKQVIYAHCIGTTKVFGPDGKRNKYHIRTLHNRDPRGACAQSFMPEGYMTTSFRTNVRRKEMVIHQAKSAGNLVSDYGCRTKVQAEVCGDMEKLFRQWDRFGWHRVTVFGDAKDALMEFGRALGLTVIEEA